MVRIAILIVSSRGMFVIKLVTSKDIRNLSYVLSCLISCMKVKLSLVVKFEGISGQSKEPRYWPSV